MSPSPPFSLSTDVFKYMPPKHVEAFKRTAGHFQVWILVRRGNPESLKWIGKAGYIPKLLDCKAKTAESDVNGPESTAGLVVSPKEWPNAFPTKLEKATEEWNKFAPKLYVFDPKTNLAEDQAGKHYTLQLEKGHKHYGCVMFKPVFRALAEYIHADYDLYATVPFADPKSNQRVSETGFGGSAHTRSPRLYDVQYFLKAAGVLPGLEAGVPMVRHGEQETFKTDFADDLDVFWPDGRSITGLKKGAEVEEFYATVLKGRRQFGPGVGGQPVGNTKWVKT